MPCFLFSLPACLFVGVNIFGSGLFTAFSNGFVSGALSFIRTFLVLTACLYGMTALLGGTGLWLAWPVAELLSLFVTWGALHKPGQVQVYLSNWHLRRVRLVIDGRSAFACGTFLWELNMCAGPFTGEEDKRIENGGMDP